MTGESSLAALQWRRPSCVPSEKTGRGRRSLMSSRLKLVSRMIVNYREIRASVPPRTAPAALHFQGDPQTDAAAAEGLRTVYKKNIPISFCLSLSEGRQVQGPCGGVL